MEFQYITQKEELQKHLKELENAPFLFLDIETTTLSSDFRKNKVRLVQFGDEKTTLVVDLFECPDCVELLKPFLSSKAWVGHNLRFDIKHLYYFYGIEPTTVFDTYIAAILLGEERKSLQAVVGKFLGEYLDKAEQSSNWGATILTQRQLEYAAKDVDILRRLLPILLKELNQKTPKEENKTTFLSERLFEQLKKTQVAQTFNLENPTAIIEMALVKEVAKLEAHGMAVNAKELDEMIKKLGKELTRAQIDFMTKYGKVDIFSPKQVGEFLKKRFGLKLPKTGKNNTATDEKTLSEYIENPAVAEILRIRKLKKVLDKIRELKQYVKSPLKPEEGDETIGRVYPFFKQIGTKTGRMSASEPNVQNIPRNLRKIFVAPSGKSLVIADFSQIELRIAAEYVGEEKMIEAFQKGEDMHVLTASLVLGKPKDQITKEERQLAKAMNYGLIYGISPKGLMEYAKFGYGVDIGLDEARRLIASFFKAFPKFYEWHKTIKKELREKGVIEGFTMGGRPYKAQTFQDAANYPIQGTGADILKLAVNIFGYQTKIQNLDAKIVNLVHDEIVCEVPQEKAQEIAFLLKESMELAGSLVLRKVPVEVDVKVSQNWEK